MKNSENLFVRLTLDAWDNLAKDCVFSIKATWTRTATLVNTFVIGYSCYGGKERNKFIIS